MKNKNLHFYSLCPLRPGGGMSAKIVIFLLNGSPRFCNIIASSSWIYCEKIAITNPKFSLAGYWVNNNKNHHKPKKITKQISAMPPLPSKTKVNLHYGIPELCWTWRLGLSSGWPFGCALQHCRPAQSGIPQNQCPGTKNYNNNCKSFSFFWVLGNIWRGTI